MNATRYLVPLFLAAGLLGCTPGATPVLESATARIAQAEGGAAVLAIGVEARNPGTVPLSLREVRYEVMVGDRRVFSGVRSPEATLGRYAERGLNFPAPITGAARPGDSYTVRGTLVYLPEGSVRGILYEAGLSMPSVGFQFQGRIAE